MSRLTRWDVVGVGANSIDFVSRLPGPAAFDAVDTRMRILDRAVWCGGQVATTLAACAAMGLHAKYVGATGHDGERVVLWDRADALALQGTNCRSTSWHPRG